MRVVLPAVFTLLALSASATVAQSPADDIAQFKKELANLRASVAALQAELTVLKTGPGAPKKPNFAARVAAAKDLNSSTDQQAAYTKIALDAAHWGEAKVCNDAIGNINSSTTQQECLYKAAIRLGALGQEAEAVTFAKRLNSSTDMQRALLKIARGDAEDKP